MPLRTEVDSITYSTGFLLVFLFTSSHVVAARSAQPMNESIAVARDVFIRHGGALRTSEAVRAGIHPRTLYRMRDEGIVEQLARGLFRLAELPPLTQPDLVTVTTKVPQGVVCLVSALSFHGMTTQIAHHVHLALLQGSERPRIDYPPIRPHFFSEKPFREGVETHTVDGVSVRVYSREKTIADCFKYRNKLGLDVALEALDLYAQSGRIDVAALLHYARICRMETVMRPYLEAILR